MMRRTSSRGSLLAVLGGLLGLLLPSCSAENGAEDSTPVVAKPDSQSVHSANISPPGPTPINPCLVLSPPQLPGPHPGDLDTSFGCAGTSTYVDAANDVILRGLAIQTDDKIVAVGSTYNTPSNNNNGWVARFTSAGDLDKTFATQGVFAYDGTVPLGGPESIDAVVIQPNGSIVLGGGFFNESAIRGAYVIRLTPGGVLDSTFGTGGVVHLTAMTWVHALGLQSNGTIAAVGEYCTSTGCVGATGRFSGVDGSPDTTFSASGVVTTGLGGTSPAHGYGAAVVGNTVVVAGDTHGASSGTDVGLVKFATNVDPTFGTSGTKTFDFATSDTARAIAPYAGGYLVASDSSNFGMMRLNANGGLVSTFGFLGYMVDGFAGYGAGINAIMSSSTQAVLAVGWANDASSRSRVAVARYTGAGKPDTTFSTDGNVMLSAAGDPAKGTAVAQQSTGRIIVGGYGTSSANKKRAVIYRLLN